MIQFNLLPDVKKDYIKAKNTKRLIMSVALGVSTVSVLVVVMLFSLVQVGQKKHIDNLTDDIKTELNSLKSIEDLDKILTIQNQLTKLPALHDMKPVTSRIFTYLTQLTPKKASVGSLVLSMSDRTLTISGRADTLATVNKFADTIKFSKYMIASDSSSTGVKPFTSVTTRLNRDNTGASYTIKLTFDSVIFDITKDIILDVPNIETTRSSTGKPSEKAVENIDSTDLFNPTTGEQ